LIDWLLGRENRWDEIIDYWNQYINLAPDSAKAYFERGGTYYHKGNLNLAIQDLKKACSLGLKEACQKLKQFQ
jgi:regulator of sirC expression with transglutaminase-like and TPR domain